MTQRHRWGPANRPSRFKTERQCERCGVVKVTRHENVGVGGESHWTEWWEPDGLARMDIDHTPPCGPTMEPT
jgi:hypothetical protein